jgi:transcriptional repressor NrdR
MVVKRDGRKELFDREKVIASLLTALRKRPVTQQQIGQLASEIEQKFTESGRSEVPTREVGDAVLAGLRTLDFIAYLRYASVYNDFAGPEDVVKLMEESRT